MRAAALHASAPRGPRGRRIVQAVAPGSGGVRDYAEALAQSWAERGLPSDLLVLGESLAERQPLPQALGEVADTRGENVTLLLHFSGYGFHRRGLCHWLLREVEQARAALGRELRVVTMFHELFASGPPWGSAFWLSSLQGAIAARLARLSDVAWTNTTNHARWLRREVQPGTPVVVRPVFSTVGEPAQVWAHARRLSRAVVFGAESTRRRAVGQLLRSPRRLEQLGIGEIVEVGAGASVVQELPCRHLFVGRLDRPALEEILQCSAYGLLDYPSIHLGKSTVFAAYATHGCVALNTANSQVSADGLVRQRDYLAVGLELPIGMDWRAHPDARDAIATNAWRWYQDHTLPRQADEFAELCGSAATQEAQHA